VERLFLEASTVLGKDVLGALKKAASAEKTDLGRFALKRIIENARVAGRMPTALPGYRYGRSFP